MSDALALSLSGIAKRFGAVDALTDARLEIRRGSLHALLGENGAGKTTLMRIAYGLLRADQGEIRVDGKAVTLRSPRDAIALGIGMVHQHFSIVPAMSVSENIALGGRGRFRPEEVAATVRAIGERTGLRLDPAARAAELSVGAQQRLEIVKALASGARTLILDEPTAVLAPTEAADLLTMLRRFVSEGGAVVLITHKMREALGAADAITVLRAGHTVWTGAPGTTNERDLARAVVGDIAAAPPRAAAKPGAVRLAARELRARGTDGAERVRGVTLEARAGELLGIAGVEGAGQHELLRALAGRLAASGGTITPAARIAFVPEDRQRDALILSFVLTENVALRGAGVARGRMRWPQWRERTGGLLERFGVRPADPDARAFALSGGNQQRLVLARELGETPDVVIAENPTRGLDVAATAATHASLLSMRDAGAAVIVYSSDLDELLELADRLIVMHGGRAKETPMQREAIAVAMLGGGA